MPRRPTLKDLKKKLLKRFDFWCLSAVFFLIVDEIIKEGYMFDIRDVLIPGTHEFLIALFVMAFVVKKVVVEKLVRRNKKK